MNKKHFTIIIYLVTILMVSCVPTPTPLHALSNYISPTVDPTVECILYSSCVSVSTPTIVYQPITWTELDSFLQVDTTNINAKNKYNPDYYNCLDFSTALVENAAKKNIKAWIVVVKFYNEENGHAFVAFETTDLGVVFIEPQLDIRTNDPVVGQHLCLAWGDYQCMGIISSIKYLQCDHLHNCAFYKP